MDDKFIEPRIAGKSYDEILSMKRWIRSRWYKTILPEEKEEAMRVVKIEMKTKMRASWTPRRKINHSIFMTGENNPTKRSDVRIKLSAAKTGKNNHMYGIIGENNPNFGSTRTEETRDKQRAAWTPERRAETSILMKNREFSEKHKDNLVKAWTPERKIKQCGENHPMKRPDVRARVSVSAIEQWKDPEFRNKRSGENHWNWQDGKSFEPYGIEFNDELKERIRKRDGYTCQECGKTQKELDRKLDVHHIDYDKQNNNEDNLISLCSSCHMKTNYNREDWIEHFRLEGVNRSGWEETEKDYTDGSAFS
jgi:hypothetical protein